MQVGTASLCEPLGTRKKATIFALLSRLTSVRVLAPASTA